MRVLLELELPAFDGTAKRVQRTDARISSPGEHELLGAARRDHLVVDQIGSEAAEGELAPALADDFVPGGERDQMGETFDDERVTVVHEARDGVLERHDF